MALDPNIPLAVKPLSVPTPMEASTEGLKLRTEALEQQQKIRDMRDQDQLRQIFAQHVQSGGDPNDLRPVLGKTFAVNPMLGLKLQGMIQQQDQQKRQAAMENLKYEAARRDAMTEELSGVIGAKPEDQQEAYTRALESLNKRKIISDEERAGLPQQLTPAVLADIKTHAIGHEKTRQQLEALGILQPKAKAGNLAPELNAQVVGADDKPIKGTVTFDKDAGVYRLDGQPLPAGARVEKAAAPEKPVDQNKLEQQYRVVLRQSLQSGSSPLGIEHKKVNSAVHLAQLFDQAYDPKTGNYNIPKAAEEDLVMGLATLLSPNARVGPQTIAVLEQPTLYGKLAGLYTYVTGTPAAAGNTQDVLKMYKKIIDRQGEQAEENRDQEMSAVRALAPTELAPERRAALESGELPSFKNRKSNIPKEKATGGGTVRMVAPDGRKLAVPEAEVDALLKLGAKRE